MSFLKICFRDSDTLHGFLIIYLYFVLFVCYRIWKMRQKISKYDNKIIANNIVIKMLQKDIIDMRDNRNNILKYRYTIF